MKKILLLLLIFGYSNSLQSKSVQDTSIPTLFYNGHTFKDGIFDVCGYPTFSEKIFTHAFIAWDLNKVVFTTPHNGMIFKKFAATHGFKKTVSLWYTFLSLWNKKKYYKIIGDPRGFVWNAMFNEVADKETRNLLFKAVQEANIVDPAIIDLIKELTLHGHTNIVLSNMGQDTVNWQIAYFEEKLKKLEKDLYTCANYNINKLPVTWYDYTSTLFTINFLKNPHNTIASKKNNWLHKPDAKSYQECLNKDPRNNFENCLKIFIDDKKENVIAAVENNLFDIAILYTNEQELRHIFWKLGPFEDSFKLVHFKNTKETKDYFIKNGCKYFKNSINLYLNRLLLNPFTLPFSHIPLMHHIFLKCTIVVK